MLQSRGLYATNIVVVIDKNSVVAIINIDVTNYSTAKLYALHIFNLQYSTHC